MSELGNIKFFITPSHPCSYLSNKRASTLFADPNLIVSPENYQALSDIGFRRSGEHLYRPHCESCNACIPMRVLVKENRMRKSHRRIWRKNHDLQAYIKPALMNDEYYDLYRRYINARHHDGDMYPPSPEQFSSFLLSSWSDTRFIEIREANTQKLLSVAVTDHLPNGLSSIYTFYDPDEERRSLGTYSLLLQIGVASEFNLPYLFIGYWIKACNKMRYKNQFDPAEMYINQHWVRVSNHSHNDLDLSCPAIPN